MASLSGSQAVTCKFYINKDAYEARSFDQAFGIISRNSPSLQGEPGLIRAMLKAERFFTFIFRKLGGEETTVSFEENKEMRKGISGNPEETDSQGGVRIKIIEDRGGYGGPNEKVKYICQIREEQEKNHLIEAYSYNQTFAEVLCTNESLKPPSRIPLFAEIFKISRA